MRLGLIVVFTLIATKAALSQGCSDAGFCTMGAMKPDQPYNKRLNVKLRSIEFSQYYGNTHFGNQIYVSTVEANISLNDKYVFQAKVPYQSNHGHLGTFQGLSDISLSLTRSMVRTDAFDVNLTVGTKLRSNDGDLAQIHGFSLPMYYQPSLGTYDFIIGASLITRKWLFAAGYQQALNANSNGFWLKEWEGDAEESYIQRYAQSNQLQRGKDVMLRVERNFRLSRFNASIGLLPIWRITRDVITNPTTLLKEDIIGSDGLALSGILTTGYNFNVRSGVKLLLGHVLVRRDFNPDGLSREFVSSITYIYHFR